MVGEGKLATPPDICAKMSERIGALPEGSTMKWSYSLFRTVRVVYALNARAHQNRGLKAVLDIHRFAEPKCGFAVS